MDNLTNLIFAAFALLIDMDVELLPDGNLRTRDLRMNGTGEPKDALTMARIALTYMGQDGVGGGIAEKIHAELERLDPPKVHALPSYEAWCERLGITPN